MLKLRPQTLKPHLRFQSMFLIGKSLHFCRLPSPAATCTVHAVTSDYHAFNQLAWADRQYLLPAAQKQARKQRQSKQVLKSFPFSILKKTQKQGRFSSRHIPLPVAWPLTLNRGTSDCIFKFFFTRGTPAFRPFPCHQILSPRSATGREGRRKRRVF